MKKYLGIDIGGTNVKFGIVDEEGNLLEKVKYPTINVSGKEGFMMNFPRLLEDYLKTRPSINAVGIGIPGTVSKDKTGTLDLPNIPSLSNKNIVGALKERLPNVKFFLENDANAAAIGEFHFGDHEISDHLILLTLGTGVGGGVILDKHIFSGGDGNGMEIGHAISGSGDSYEYHLGKKGIVRWAQHYLHRNKGASFLDIFNGDFTAKDVVKAARKGDKVALKVFKKLGKYLGQCIVSSVRVFDIKNVVIGGGVSETFGFMEASMTKEIEKNLPNYYLKDLKIEIATLKNEAGIIGAASLCIED